MAVEKYYEWLWKYWIYHKFMKLPIEHHIFLAIFSSQKFFWRKIFHKLRVVHNIFFPFAPSKRWDELVTLSKSWLSYYAYLSYVWVWSGKYYPLTSFDNFILFFATFYWASFTIFFHILFRRLATAIDTSRDT